MMARRRTSAVTRPAEGALRANTLRDERAPNTLGGMSSAPAGPTSRSTSRGAAPAGTRAGAARSVMAPTGGSRQPASAARAANGQNGAARAVTGLRLPWWLLVIIAIVVYLVALNVLGAPQ